MESLLTDDRQAAHPVFLLYELQEAEFLNIGRTFRDTEALPCRYITQGSISADIPGQKGIAGRRFDA